MIGPTCVKMVMSIPQLRAKKPFELARHFISNYHVVLDLHGLAGIYLKKMA